jgi:hypothetical protein
VAAAIADRIVHPFAVALAANAFVHISTIFAAIMPDAFALLEATLLVLLTDIFLFIARVAI